MGLFDSIAGEVAGALSKSSGGTHGPMLDAVLALINDPRVGGVQGLVQAFERNGLGGVVASWIGSGENLPISGSQLATVLGSEHIQSIAKSVGQPAEEVSGQLAGLLPQVIDKLSPTGTLPEGDALGEALGLLKGFLK